MDYERVIGLEVHCELKTNSKMFSASPVTFGEDPNTMINEVDMGMTGTLPCLNKRGVEFAIRVCHALHMEIDELLCFDRKNYYYSDLPKGFQITQDKRPIGRNGYSLIDYNRAGIPLIEIVTKPCIRSGKEASAYLEALRQVFLYTEVSDAKLEEGSMRCDVNVSIRPFGQEAFGTRTEIKNLNSISNVQKAIDYEAGRQQEVIESGGEVLQETRRYDEVEKVTTVMRSKGDAVDYKYYTEPNILPIRLDHAWVEQIKDELPMMAGEREKHYEEEYGIPKVDAKILVSTKSMSDYFNEVIKYTKNYKNASNWLLGDVLAFLNKNNQSYDDIELNPEYLAKLINFIEDGSKQAKKVFEPMMTDNKDPEKIIEEKGMKQISDPNALKTMANEVLDANPQSIEDYANGKDRAVGFLVGQVMKKSRGQANPGMVNKLLVELLKERIKKLLKERIK